jgi:hypothetical protein
MISCTVAFSLLMAGCMGKDFIKPTQTEIDAYIQSHPDLPELDKACIYDGRFEIGMKKETVRFLLGEPRSLEIIQQPWAQQEKWTYKRGNFKVFYMEDGGVVGIEEN